MEQATDKEKLKLIEAVLHELCTADGSDIGSVHVAKLYLQELIKKQI